MVVNKSNETFRSGFATEIAFWHDEFSRAGSDHAYKELCRDQLAILVKRQKAFEHLVKAYGNAGSDLEVNDGETGRWCALWGSSETADLVQCQIFDQNVFIGSKRAASVSDLLHWCVTQGFTEPVSDSVNLMVEPEWRKGIQVSEANLAA
ncbi:hypothetical protein [Marinobacter alkaliphilus]|uniref:Uncharacterized protein n=1 Tax=Marinobacter alkaliphilus TaxID=254719 RepID=A0ABZ3EAP1_9GAMM